MDKEEKILNILEVLVEQVGGFEARLGSIDSRLDSVDSRLDSVDSRLDSVDGRLDSVDGRLDSVDGRLDSVDGRLSKLELKIENDVADKIQILFEGQQAVQEVLKDHTDRLTRIEDKVADHTLQIKVLDNTKSNKRKKTS